MRRLSFLLGIVVLFQMSSIVYPQAVVVTLKDGQQVVGEIVDFRNGAYLVKTEARVVEIPESQILNVEHQEMARPAVTEKEVAPPPVPPKPKVEILDLEYMEGSSNPEAQQAFNDARFLEKQGFVAEAMALYEKAFQIDPWFLAARLGYAKAALEDGELDLAIRQANKILEVDANNILALRIKADARRKGGYLLDSLLVEAEIIDIAFPPPQNLYEKAHLWMTHEKMDRALKAWLEYLKADPQQVMEFNEEARAMREGEAALRRRDFEKALTSFYKAARLNPLYKQKALERVAAVHRERADDYYAREVHENAIPDIEALKELLPEQRESLDAEIFAIHQNVIRKWINLAKFDDVATRLSEAKDKMESARFRDLLSSAVAHMYENARRHALRPGFREVLACMQKAASEIEAADEILQLLGKTWYEVANVEVSKGVKDKAIADYEAAASLNPELRELIEPAVTTMRFDWAKTLMKEKEFKTAITHLEAVLEKEPEHPEAGTLLNEARFEHMKNLVEAEETLGKKISIVKEMIPLLKGEFVFRAEMLLEELEREKYRISQIERIRREMLAYYPVVEGAWWKYRNPTGDMIEKREITTLRWDGKNLIAKVTHTSILGDTTRPLKYNLVNDGRDLFYVRTDGDADDREYLFRFPIEVGKSWSWKQGEVMHSRTYLSYTERVSTPLRTFPNCLKVEFRSTYHYGASEPPYEIVIYNYFAPGVGLVKSDMVGDDFYDLELIEYFLPEDRGVDPTSAAVSE